jgi:hypothetical protein
VGQPLHHELPHRDVGVAKLRVSAAE